MIGGRFCITTLMPGIRWNFGRSSAITWSTVEVAFVARLELNAERAGIEAAARAARPHRVMNPSTLGSAARILRRLVLMPPHLGEGHAVGAFGVGADLAGIFGRQEVLRHDAEQLHRRDDADKEKHHNDNPVRMRPCSSAGFVIAVLNRVKAALAQPIEHNCGAWRAPPPPI